MARARNTRKISRPCSDRLRDQQSPFPADSTCECDLSRTITAPAWSAWISAKFIQPLADPDASSRPTRVSQTVVCETATMLCATDLVKSWDVGLGQGLPGWPLIDSRHGAIDRLVAGGHRGRREPSERLRAAHRAIKLMDAPAESDQVVIRLTKEAGQAIGQHLRHRATQTSDDRCATRQGLGHHQAKRLGPVNREEESQGVPQERGFLRVADLPHQL